MCISRAEWTIVYGRSPDDVTEACTEHVGVLLEDGVENHVYPIEIDNTEEAIAQAMCCLSGF